MCISICANRRWVGIGIAVAILTTGSAIAFTAAVAGAGDRSRAEKVTVIGMDALDNAAGFDIPADQYRAALTSGLSAVNTSIRPALKARAPAAKAEGKPEKTWNLRTIGVGVGLRAEFGLGPIFKVKLAPRLRLVFTNSLDPIYPD